MKSNIFLFVFVIAVVTAVDGVENTANPPVTAESAENHVINGRRRVITDRNFISPLFGQDDPLDFVLDEVFISLSQL